MSGDVQPRRRKDKKKKKDELGVEEPRGTAAVFGDGDVFIHSQHDHGTGGHWCAKIIFFSLLAVLVTLIGLIILENRGLSEFEASVVESQYSGFLEGWLEDAPEDDHHDEHTLELKHIVDDHEEDEKTEETDVEKTAKDLFDVEPVSNESPELLEDDNVFSEENEDFKSGEEDEEDKQDEFLESNEDDEPPLVEPITAPTDKPLEEVEESTSSEKPPDTLKEEEEYEKRQEELRREEAQASHMWLKLVVGGALLAATHAVVRRASTSRDMPERSERSSRGEIPTIIDRRMTLIPEEEFLSVTPQKISEVSRPQFSREVKSKVPLIIESASPDQESEEELEVEKFTAAQTSKAKNVEDKELYSDDEEIEEEIVEPPKKEIVKQITPTETRKTPERQTMDQPEEEMLDDVEIIDDEQLEEELEDEGDEEEEDISDVDDAELLSRLEAKYGRLPEPERSRQRNKDGGNSIDDDWYDEPSDPQWRQHLNQAEEELRRFQEWLEN